MDNPKGRQWRCSFINCQQSLTKNMQLKSEEQINEEYRVLSSHQRCRILLINKSCHRAAQSIFANTPHTPEVLAAVEGIRKAMEVAVETIATEHLIKNSATASDAGNVTGGEE